MYSKICIALVGVVIVGRARRKVGSQAQSVMVLRRWYLRPGPTYETLRDGGKIPRIKTRLRPRFGFRKRQTALMHVQAATMRPLVELLRRRGVPSHPHAAAYMGLWRSWGKGNDLPFLCDPHLLSGKLSFSLSCSSFLSSWQWTNPSRIWMGST